MPQCPNPKLQFLCNDFGMSRGVPAAPVCVELYAGGGLSNLTACCTNAVFDSWGGGPEGLASTRYEQAQRAVAAVEEQLKQNFKFEQYCHGVNRANEKKQSVECAPLDVMLNYAKNQLKAISAATVPRPSGAPSTASPAPGAGAGSPSAAPAAAAP